jgi:hypothetical protein
MITIRIPDRVIDVRLQDTEARVRHCSVIHAATVEEAVRDDMGVILSIGPLRVYASADQAEDLAQALLQMANHIRETATAQVAEA